jgi:D-arabinose 1-dehydrogenase-like Zn-dependent alcohol dehydrogenase
MNAIPKTSRAACVVAFGHPLEIRHIPIPEEIEPGAILVRTEVASICGSDVHLWQGELGAGGRIQLPIILGHEMMGRVARLGPGVKHDSAGQPLAEGDRIVWTHASCGACFACTVTHQPTLCPNRRMYMFTNCEQPPYLLGGFSEYCYVFPASGRLKIPDEVSSELASAASCALRTVVHGFDRLGRVENRDSVVIQGAGPLGLYATAMAVQAGAQQVIVIEVSGGATAFPEGIDLVRRGGRYLVIGQVGEQQPPIAPRLIVEKQLTILGVMSGDTDHYYKALQFIKHNRHRFSFEDMLSNRYPLDRINEALEAMRTFREVKAVVVP